MSKLEKYIHKFALANAYEHEGRAQTGAIIGKLIASSVITKIQISKARPKIDSIIKEVNRLSLEEQGKELKKIYPSFFKKKEVKEELKPLPGAKTGKVVTRMPPEPSKYIHIGHALSFLINYQYAKKYKGKCVLRFEDTNAEKAKKEFVNATLDDLKYLEIKPDKVVYVSDDIPKMYKLAEKLIGDNKAYVCLCDKEKVRKLRHRGEECECKKWQITKNKELWSKMLARGFKEGEATLRLKIDMSSPNHALRDPVIFRINYANHYRQGKKYCIWPLYDFANACEDEWCGITHILRSAEFGEMRIELQKHIRKLFKFKDPYVFQYGRFDVIGATTSGRELLKLVKEKFYSGWDDIRLVTIRTLRRRGIVPETFCKLAIKVGLSKTPTNIDWALISAVNRQVIDPIADRYFFVPNPIEIKVEGSPKLREASIKVHPDKKNTKKIKLGAKFYVSREDFVNFKGKEVRLKDLFNIKLDKKSQFTSKPNKDIPKIQWVSEPNIKIEMLKPEGIVKGLAEPAVSNLKSGDTAQFERIGFVKCERKNFFVFGHK